MRPFTRRPSLSGLARRAIPAALLLACGNAAPPAPQSSPPPPPPPAPTAAPAAEAKAAPPDIHRRFSDFTARFLHDYLERSPVDATNLGDHSFDAQWDDLSAEGDAKTIQALEATRAELASFASAELDQEERTDASILANCLAQTRYLIEEQRGEETMPILYTTVLSAGLDALLTRDFAPLDVRMKSLAGRLRGVPAVVAVAKKRLSHPARVNTETAIEQTKGLVRLCDGELPKDFAKLPASSSALKEELEAARQTALPALRELESFLEKDLLPRSDGSFRAGPAAFEKILRYDLDDPSLDPDALLRDARAAMVDTRARMLATAIELWPTLMKGPIPHPTTEAEKNSAIRRVLDKLAEEHDSDKTIVGDAKQVLAEATAFVKAHDLVGLPDEPCEVIEMPEYKRGFSTAYCESSGPLEAHPQTFVAIAPPPASWTAARRASQYREYNHSMLAELLVHEGMPGHYLQIMHSNRFHSAVRTVFQNGAFVEGWAVYGEWLMAKHGFGGPKVRMEQLKMLLRAATNTVLDHEIHAGAMDEKAALDLMEKEAFQEEGEAVGKWRRARLSRGQLSTYFYGFRELMKLREEAERAPGFVERTYNDRLVAFGSPPLRVARERMASSGRAAP